MEKTFKELEYNRILEMLSEYAYSDRVRKRLLNLRPIMNESQLNAALEETTQAKRILNISGNPPLAIMTGVEKVIWQIEKDSRLNPGQLTAVSTFIGTCSRMKRYLKRMEEDCIGIASIGQSIYGLSTLRDEIDLCIRGDEIDDRASAALASVRRSIAKAHDQVKAKLETLLKRNSSYFSESFIVTRHGRLTLAVKSKFKNQVNGSVVDVSKSGGTVFMEPDAVTRLQGEIASMKVTEELEVNKVLYALTALVEDSLQEIKINMEAMETLDFVFAKARLSINLGCVQPKIITDRVIKIDKGRHPLLDRDSVIPLDFEIGEAECRGVVITGPNTGGKTVVLKTVGLFVLMGQSGLHVPAENMVMGMHDQVLCDIGDGQSITENLSTFSSHITRIIDILGKAGRDSLVLLDELGSGTDPAEGMGLATVILQELLKKNCLLVATTHYPEIKDYARETKGLINARMTFDRENLMPLYKLEIGEAGESCALYIAGRLGMPVDMIRAAHKAAYSGRLQSKPHDYDFSRIKGKKLKKSKVYGLKRLQDEDESISKVQAKFTLGDSVIVHPSGDMGLVFRPADDNGMVGVQIKKKKYLVNHKRVELHIPASELYPDDYDFSIIFDTVANRKARHKMNKRHDPSLTVELDDEYEVL